MDSLLLLLLLLCVGAANPSSIIAGRPAAASLDLLSVNMEARGGVGADEDAAEGEAEAATGGIVVVSTADSVAAAVSPACLLLLSSGACALMVACSCVGAALEGEVAVRGGRCSGRRLEMSAAVASPSRARFSLARLPSPNDLRRSATDELLAFDDADDGAEAAAAAATG